MSLLTKSKAIRFNDPILQSDLQRSLSGPLRNVEIPGTFFSTIWHEPD